MSDAEEGIEEPDVAADQETSGELDEEDYAEVDAIDEDAAAEIIDASAEEDGENDGEDADDGSSGPPAIAEDGTPEHVDASVGMVYCRGLGVLSAALIDRTGDGEADLSATAEEYSDLAEDMDLDDLMNQYWAENVDLSGEDDAGTALVAATALFAISVTISEPELLEGLLGDDGEEVTPA